MNTLRSSLAKLHSIPCILTVLLTLSSSSARANLQDTFLHPPDSAKPWTFWFWINGNITREGITADLEAMAKAGIGGVLIMEVARPSNMAPAGPVAFASDEWTALFKHMLAEAGKHGIKVNMNNDAGWCGSGGPWVKTDESMQKLIATTTTLSGPQHAEVKLPEAKSKLKYYRDVKVLAYPVTAEAKSTTRSVAQKDVLDLSDKMDASGKFVWDVPAGQWQVMRIGVTTTGAKNKPAPESGTGLECDKFSAKAVKHHIDAFIGKLCASNRAAVGSVLVSTHIDSWEVGTQDWTPNMLQEFRKRRGYDLTPWLPVLASDRAGVVIGDELLTQRFLWDFKRTCSELVDEAYAGAAREAAKSHGLQLSIEGYGGAKWLNPLTYGAQCDVPTAEFWISRWGAWHILSPRLLASVGHVFGKPIIAAESFTAGAAQDPFTEHPYSVKSLGDWAMCEGVNRFVFHRTALNPWPDVKPGMNFAGWGWHVDPAQPWYNSAGQAYFKYLARCQALLQQGNFVADICRLVPDGESYGAKGEMVRLPGQYDALPSGYGYDYLSDRALLSECSVETGRIVTPGGASYRVLQLPNSSELLPEVLEKVAEFAKAGVIVLGRAPERSPGLRDYPNCDEKVKTLAAEVWGNDPAATSGKQAYGTGRIAWGDAQTSAIAVACDGPDLTYALTPEFDQKFLEPPTKPKVSASATEPAGTMPTEGLNWIHRRTDDGIDYYFIANPQYREVHALCSFRVMSTAPEVWDPATGEMKDAAVWSRVDGRVVVPLHFDAAGSLFVVFRKTPDSGKQIIEVKQDGKVLFGDKTTTAVPIPGVQLTTSGAVLTGGKAGQYRLLVGEGRTIDVRVEESPTPMVISGPWQVEFQNGRGAPAGASQFAQLTDWSKHSEEGIRYFSGTATYRAQFNWNDQLSTAPVHYTLSLGDVQIAADVTLNGKRLGVVWKAPFAIDATTALRPGKNDLEVTVSNQWPNRLIGDEQYADDCTTDSRWKTGPLPAWPDWFKNNTARPEPGRLTFTTWKYFTKDSPLLPSGLLGPVTIGATTMMSAEEKK